MTKFTPRTLRLFFFLLIGLVFSNPVSSSPFLRPTTGPHGGHRLAKKEFKKLMKNPNASQEDIQKAHELATDMVHHYSVKNYYAKSSASCETFACLHKGAVRRSKKKLDSWNERLVEARARGGKRKASVTLADTHSAGAPAPRPLSRLSEENQPMQSSPPMIVKAIPPAPPHTKEGTESGRASSIHELEQVQPAAHRPSATGGVRRSSSSASSGVGGSAPGSGNGSPAWNPPTISKAAARVRDSRTSASSIERQDAQQAERRSSNLSGRSALHSPLGTAAGPTD